MPALAPALAPAPAAGALGAATASADAFCFVLTGAASGFSRGAGGAFATGRCGRRHFFRRRGLYRLLRIAGSCDHARHGRITGGIGLARRCNGSEQAPIIRYLRRQRNSLRSVIRCFSGGAALPAAYWRGFPRWARLAPLLRLAQRLLAAPARQAAGLGRYCAQSRRLCNRRCFAPRILSRRRNPRRGFLPQRTRMVRR